MDLATCSGCWPGGLPAPSVSSSPPPLPHQTQEQGMRKKVSLIGMRTCTLGCVCSIMRGGFKLFPPHSSAATWRRERELSEGKVPSIPDKEISFSAAEFLCCSRSSSLSLLTTVQEKKFYGRICSLSFSCGIYSQFSPSNIPVCLTKRVARAANPKRRHSQASGATQV